MQWVSPRPPTPQQIVEWRTSPEGQAWLKAHRHPPQARPVGAAQPIKTPTERQFLNKAYDDAVVAIQALSGSTTGRAFEILNVERMAIEEQWEDEQKDFVRMVAPMAYYAHVKRVTVDCEVKYPQRVFDEVVKAPAAMKNRCECGASKTGIADYAMGHSSWCPVKG